MERYPYHIPSPQRNIYPSQMNHLRSVPPAIHNFHPHVPADYHHTTMPNHYAPQSYGSSAAIHNHPMSSNYSSLPFHQTARVVDQHTVIRDTESGWTLKLTWEHTPIPSSHGNNPYEHPMATREMGRLQIPQLEMYGNLDSHYRPSYTDNYQLNLNQPPPHLQVMRGNNHPVLNLNQPPPHLRAMRGNSYQLNMNQPPPHSQAERGNNFNLEQPQVPRSSSSYGHQMYNPQQHHHPSWRTTGDVSNRNFRSSIPISQMNNWSTLPQEHNILRGLDSQLLDDVVVMDDLYGLFDEDEDIQDRIDYLQVLFDLMGDVHTASHTGLSEEEIQRHLKIRTPCLIDLNEEPPSPAENPQSSDEEPHICVICQAEYENRERIGTLECGHEYHADCIKKWLQEKNECPVCKATGLTIGS